MIWIAIALNVVGFIGCFIWLRALKQARGGYTPCTDRPFSLVSLLLGIASLVVWPVLVMPLAMVGHVKGTALNVPLFILLLATMSAVPITCMLGLTAWYANRNARLWVQLQAPSTIRVREGENEFEMNSATLRIERSIVFPRGVGGMPWVEYRAIDDAHTLTLHVMHSIHVRYTPSEIEQRPLRGLNFQGRAGELPKFMEPLCVASAAAQTSD